MNKKIIIAVSLIIAAALAVAGYVYLKKTGRVSPSGVYAVKHYDVGLIDLGKIPGVNAETAEKYKNKFIEYQDKLERAVKEYNDSGKKEDKKPDPDYFIEKARYAQYLGQNDWAIEILNNVFDYYQNSSVTWNNLAKIYENKKDYARANEYYFKIINTFSERETWGEYYYIIKNYMALGDKAKVREYYDKYLKLGGSKDGEIEEFLK